MKKLIISYKTLGGLFVAICIVTVGQFGAREAIRSWTKVWEGAPTFISWQQEGNIIKMKLSCDGKHGITTDVKLLMSQIKNPDASLPTAILYEDGSVNSKSK